MNEWTKKEQNGSAKIRQKNEKKMEKKRMMVCLCPFSGWINDWIQALDLLFFFLSLAALYTHANNKLY